MADEAVADEGQRIADLERRLQHAETLLRLSNGKLRMALEVSKLGSWERDMATGEVAGTPIFKANLGLPPETALTYDDLQRIFHPGDIDRINQAVSFALKTKTDFNIEHRIIRPDGRIGRLLVRGCAIYEDGQPVRLMGITQDVTERERAKEEIHRSQRRQEFLLELNDRLRSLVDPDAIMEATARSLGLYLKVDCAGYGEVNEDRGVILVEREWSKGAISNEGRAYRLYDFLPTMTAELKQGRTIFVEDIKNDPRADNPEVQAAYSTLNARTALAVPLLTNDKLTALLYLHSSEPRSWTSDELTLVEDIAKRTWIAVEKARTEAELRETEGRFRVIAESLPALVWIIDLELRLTYTNDRWLTFSGLPPTEALGDSWMRWVHPDDLARVVEEMKAVRQNESSYSTEMRYRSVDDVYRWHMVQAAPLRDAKGELKGWVGTSVDIHDLKVTEEALRRSEEQLRLALEVAQMGDWSWNAATDIITLSDRAADIFGLTAGTSVTWASLRELIHPADAQRADAAMEKAAATGTNYDIEYRVQRAKDNARVWVAVQGRTLFDPDGTFIGITGVMQDITDRKHAEERQQLLIRELHHRVKNTLATVQAIVGSTARTASSIDEFYQGFVGRIVSLARTHNLLTEDLWQKAALEDLVQTELGPYEDEARNRIIIDGPHVELPSEAAVPIGMAIHELTTNAAKHGALSTFGGQVKVSWRIEPGEPPRLRFTWSEHGGPPVTAPSQQGFGSRLLQRVLTTQLQARVNMDFRGKGLHFTMDMPIPSGPPLFNPDR